MWFLKMSFLDVVSHLASGGSWECCGGLGFVGCAICLYERAGGGGWLVWSVAQRNTCLLLVLDVLQATSLYFALNLIIIIIIILLDSYKLIVFV